MKVQAAPGLKVPMEEKPRDYIVDDTPVEVPDTAYYQRRITDGDLLDVVETEVIAPVTKAKKGA